MHNFNFCDRDLVHELLDAKSAKARLRQFIFDEWGNECAYCETELTTETATLDHVKSKFRGGQDRVNNLVPCCDRCNQNKGSREWFVWYRSKNFLERGQRECDCALGSRILVAI